LAGRIRHHFSLPHYQKTKTIKTPITRAYKCINGHINASQCIAAIWFYLHPTSQENRSKRIYLNHITHITCNLLKFAATTTGATSLTFRLFTRDVVLSTVKHATILLAFLLWRFPAKYLVIICMQT